MNANRVQKIFTANLAKCENLGDASVESCKEISENAFAEASHGQNINAENWEMLLKLIDGQARLSYFWELPTQYIPIADTKLFKHMIFLLKVYENAVRYCYKNYYLLSEGSRKINEKEDLKKLADSISFRIQERTAIMTQDGITFFPHQELNYMADVFAVTARLILGDEIFVKFRETNNKSIRELRRLYMESVTCKTNSVN